MATDSLAISLFSRANSTTPGGIDIAREIQCYSLPYGGVGFTSHVLTYYTIICLWGGRKPTWPFRPVKYSWYDLALGVGSLCLSTATAIVTIVKCRNTWQLMVIAIWKLSLSLLNGLTAIHVAVLFLKKRRNGQRERAHPEVPMDEAGPGQVRAPAVPRVSGPFNLSASWWILLYLPGMLAGMCGLMNLVIRNEGAMENVHTFTVVFYCYVGIGLLLFAVSGCGLGGGDDASDVQDTAHAGLWIAVGSFVILAVFYCDWMLGMMTSNLAGLPKGESFALYWTYFVSKRLPMLSW